MFRLISRLQAAINAASAGDTIKVFPGTYNETAPGSTLTAQTAAVRTRLVSFFRMQNPV